MNRNVAGPKPEKKPLEQPDLDEDVDVMEPDEAPNEYGDDDWPNYNDDDDENEEDL